MQKLTKQEITKILDQLIENEKAASIQINHSGNGQDEFTACYIKLPIDKLNTNYSELLKKYQCPDCGHDVI